MSDGPRTNPNGANQYTLDPRQKICWDFYVNPKSETFGNAKASAIKAGYTEGTACQITTENWFIERLRRLQLLGKAEKVLDETLVLPALDEDGKFDKGIQALKLDAAKFVAKTQGKNEGYSERQEITGAEGKPLILPSEIIKMNGLEPSTGADRA